MGGRRRGKEREREGVVWREWETGTEMEYEKYRRRERDESGRERKGKRGRDME